MNRARDLIPSGSRLVSALHLTYSFELKEDSSNVKLRAPPLNERLYESLYESQLTSIFDANKRFLFATDAFEKGKALPAGKYTARIQVRHDERAMLEKLKDMPVVLETALAKAIELPAYASYTQAAAVGGAKFGANKVVKAGRAGTLFLGMADAKSFPSCAKPGDWAQGSFTLAKGEFGGEKGGTIKLRVYAPAAAAPAAAATPAVTSTPVSAVKKDTVVPNNGEPKKPVEVEADPAYPKLEQKDPAASSPPPAATPAASPTPATAAAAAASNSAAASSASSSSSPAPSSLATELRDLTITHLEKLKSGAADADKKIEALRTVLPPLLASFPNHLPLLFLELRLLHEVNQSRPRGSAEREEGLAVVQSKAQQLLTEKIDQTSLLAHFGRVVDSSADVPAEVTALRKEKEETRRIVLKTLALQLELAVDELRTSHRERLRAVEYQAAARAELDALASSAASSSSSPSAFALSLASFHALLAEAGSWASLTAKEHKKTFAPFQSLATKIARQYGLVWKNIAAEQTAQAASGDSATLKALQQDKIELLTAMAERSPLYAHLLDYERDQLVVRFPNDFPLWG
jgi:hypothetical protein